MRKLILFVLLFCAGFSVCEAGRLQEAQVGVIVLRNGVDATAPTCDTATIGTNGTALTLGMSETVTRSGGTFDVDCSTAGANITATYSSGSGSNSLVYTLGTTVNSGDTCNLDYNGASNGIEDAAGNDLASITDKAITNNSTQGGGYQTPSYVNSNSGYNSGPATLSGVTAGNNLTLLISGDGSMASATVSGGCAVSWQSVTQLGACGWVYSRIFYCENATGGATSITLGSLGTDPGWSLHEYSGLAQSSSIITSTGLCNPNTSAGSYGTSNITFSQPGVIVAINANERSDIFSSWGASLNARTAQTSHFHRTADRIITSNGDYNASVSTSECSPNCTDDSIYTIGFKARAN